MQRRNPRSSEHWPRHKQKARGQQRAKRKRRNVRTETQPTKHN